MFNFSIVDMFTAAQFKIPLDELLVLALALWQALEIWHHGEIFAWVRKMTGYLPFWIAFLCNCMFCLGPWVATAISSAWLLSPWLSSNLAIAVRIGVYALAMTRLAQLMNDLTYQYCRTPKSE